MSHENFVNFPTMCDLSGWTLREEFMTAHGVWISNYWNSSHKILTQNPHERDTHERNSLKYSNYFQS